MLRIDFDTEPKPTRLAQILNEHFACSADLAALLEAGAEYMSLASGETLFTQGDPGDDVYFVLGGRLRASVTSVAGEQRVLGEIGRGETIGELAMFTGEARSATVVALREAMLARVSRQLIERIISRRPQVAMGLTRLVIERYRRSNERRPAASVPVTVCLLPISPGVDALAFARALRARQPHEAGQIAVLDGQQFGPHGTGEIPARRHDLARHLEVVEQQNSAVYLVAGRHDDAWTRFCLQHADEILLVADATADPARSEIEARLLSAEAPIAIARQTLVLLHPADTPSSRQTSRWLVPRGRPRHFHVRASNEADLARLARVVSGRAIGLVLSGGGARGLAHIGVYRAMAEAGIAVDFVGGTSIGAVIGALIAIGVDARTLADTVRDTLVDRRGGGITGDYNLLPLLSLLKGDRSREALARTIRRHAGHDIDMEDTWKPLFSVASNFSSGREEVLRDGPLAASLAASYAIPGALPPVLRDGQLLFDGATFNNFPVDLMAGLGVGKVVGVELSDDQGERLDLEALPGPLSLLRDRLRPADTQRYRRLPTMPETLMLASFITSGSRQRAERQRCDLLFHPALPQIGPLDWRQAERIIDAGYSHAQAVLAANAAALVGYR